MFEKNIFIRKYDVAENKLTEAFMRFLFCLEKPLLRKVLRHMGTKKIGNDTIEFDMQIKSKESIPDAMIFSCDKFVIYVEVKRTSPLSLSQLRRHAKFLLRSYAKQKVLLIISPDYYQIEEIKNQWKNVPESKLVIGLFISWTEIWRILQKLIKGSNLKDRFLLSQFTEYLKEEGVVIMTQRIRERDAVIWRDFVKFALPLENVLKQEIQACIQKLEPKWNYVSFSYIRASDMRLHFNTAKTSKYLRFYAGFYSGSKEAKGWEDACFYLGWEPRGRHRQKLISHRLFNGKEKKLKARGFIPWTRGDFYNILKIKDIAKKKTTERQIQYIKDFITDSIKKFNKARISELL